MKKILLLSTLFALLATSIQAQLSNGSIAPDWTMTDINGTEHHLYEYLDNGYTVVIDFSATWCGPCWSYHTSGALEELYINHGPAGMPNVSANTTDDVMVFFIEGDGDTTLDDLNGTGTNTQGNWVVNTPYPIIDNDAMTDPYQINFWPTIYTVCSNREITLSGQISTEAHYEIAHECQIQNLEYQTVNTSASSILGVDSNTAFTFNITNEGTGQEELRLTLTSNAPADWSGTVAAGGASDANSIDITVSAGMDLEVTLNAIPGTTPALAEYTVVVESITSPDNAHLFMNYSVISGITDIVVENEGIASDQTPDFVSGLESANNTSFGVISINKFIEGIENNQLGEIGHVYYNIAWTFPSFTNEGVAALSTFLDNGGNLLVCGQDIGWDTWDSAADGTTQTKAFYTDYLSADYQNDGGNANSTLNWETEDFLYGEASNSSINDIHNGNFYPDEIDPIDPAVAIYHYGSNASKTGGIRVQENGHKVVYIGVDLGMIGDVEARNQTVQLAHDWFHGIITSIEFDETFKNTVGNVYPNPMTKFATIPFENLQENIRLTIINSLGKVVFEKNIPKGTNQYQIELENLSTGLYHCVLTSNNGSTKTLSLEVVK